MSQRKWAPAILFAFGWAALASAQMGGLPAGPAQDKARQACLACHNAEIILQQQLDRATWTKEMDKMIRWGAKVDKQDRDALIDYFAQNFGPRASPPPGTPLVAAPGEDKVRAACLRCHGPAVIASPKLDRAGWSRMLDRMLRWGASIKSDDRGSIVDYLATHYGPSEEKPKQK
jgi:cytochrome c553